MIEKGTYQASVFVDELKTLVSEIVENVKNDNSTLNSIQNNVNVTDNIIGTTCPKCGKGKVIKGNTAYGCSRWKEGCDYRVFF
jgi:DNA topoisomerase-3